MKRKFVAPPIVNFGIIGQLILLIIITFGNLILNLGIPWVVNIIGIPLGILTYRLIIGSCSERATAILSITASSSLTLISAGTIIFILYVYRDDFLGMDGAVAILLFPLLFALLLAINTFRDGISRLKDHVLR